ncbi:MAG TPA: PQQ-binding-like beta-propeller repeat protein [Blastocatellia bacterium]|nr:PQQ-binding-like beta-propeller repeat protein [Blastocatellia bacterium]
MGDLVLIGSCVGTFFALDRQTGKVRWSYDIAQDGNQSSFHGSPLVVNDEIIIGTDGGGIGYVYAFQTATGKVLWKYRITKGAPGEAGVPTDIVRLDDSVFGVTFGDELISLHSESGKVNWTFPSGYMAKKFIVPQSPAVGIDRVFFGGINGTVYALSAGSGGIIWKRDLGSRVSTNLTVAGADLYAGTADGYIFRLNTVTGEIASQMKLEATPVGWPTLAGNSLLVYLNPDGGSGGASTLLSLDPALKQIRWQQQTASNWSLTRPFLWRSSVLAGNEKGEVKAFRLSDGAELWGATLKGTIRSFGSDKEVIFIGTLGGIVYAYQPAKL